MKLKFTLVEDAEHWWKMNSMQALLVAGAVAEWWLNSQDLQALLPPKVASCIVPVAVVVVGLLRLRKQILAIRSTRGD
jgi:hypothetical protein